jgi:glycosyltransferase involved in cell wall biosynthesis
MTSKISVIIPVYNREKYISNCLDSVINQTYNNLEIICVDDKSTDTSLDIINQYAKKDKRIKVISLSENGGVSNARNTGIKNATGDFLAFVDSDDTIDSTMYQELIDAAEKTGADIVTSDLEMIQDGNLRDMKINLAPYKIYEKPEIEEKICSLFSYPSMSNLGLLAFSTKLYSRSLIIGNIILFEKGISYEEDKLFVIEAFCNCKKFYYIPKHFYRYVTGHEGLYSAFNKNGWIWYINAFEKYYYLIDRYSIRNINFAHINESFIYNITWFLYRAQRIKDRKERKSIINKVICNTALQKHCKTCITTLTSVDKLMAKSIILKNSFIAIKVIDFVYSGKKDKLFKIIKR